MADERIIHKEFTPSGGMNQDDSMITPARESESGRSLFELGDYRYALNARIGSSRSDSMGDLENIIDSELVTDYFVRGDSAINSEFDDGLTSWNVLGQDKPWSSVPGIAVSSITGVAGTYNTDILYQPINQLSGYITLQYSTRAISLFNSAEKLYFHVVFLNGTTVISDITYVYDQGDPPKEDVKTLLIPDGATNVGFYARVRKGTATAEVSVYYFKIISWVTGLRPSGSEKAIGRYEDKEFLKLWYAVYNSEGNHCIRYYDAATDAVYELMRWSGLKFQPTYFVKFAKLNEWLAFTDRNNAPRLINTNTISDLFLTLGSDFREFHISFHKWAPVMPPIIERLADDPIRNFKGKGIFQFSYRYIYFGGLRSRWSPISVAHRARDVEEYSPSLFQWAIQVRIPGFILDDEGANVQWNYFGHDSQKFLRAVEYIEIAYKDGIEELWKVWKRVKTSELPSDFTFPFYNNELRSLAVVDDLFQQFDTVPFRAGTVEAIDNRFMFGDCLNEQPIAEDVVVNDVGTANTVDNNRWNTDGGYTGLSASEQTEYVAQNATGKSFNFKARSRIKCAIQYLHHTGWKSLAYTSDNWLYEIPAAPPSSYAWGATKYNEPPTALEFKLADSFRPPEWAVAYQILRSNNLDITYFISATCNLFDYLVDNPGAVRGYESSSQSVKDTVDTYFNNDNLVTATEVGDIAEETADSIGRLRLRFAEKAEKKGKDSLARQLRASVRSTLQGALANASRIAIDINNWYNSSKKNSSGTENNPMNDVYYDFRDGDRVRFVGSNEIGRAW